MLSERDKINSLNRIGIALSKTTQLKELFELIVTECKIFTNADAGSLYTIEDGKLIFRVAQTDSITKRLGHKAPFKAFPLPLAKTSISGYVALTGEVIHVDDCYELDPEKGPGFNRSYDESMDYRSKSMLVVPMRDANEEVIGVIQLINAMDTGGEIISFHGDFVELMLSTASQSAIALQNARLLAEVKNLFAAFVKYSATAVDERSPHAAGHTRRVAGMSMRLAKAVSEQKAGPFADVTFSDQELEELWFAAWLHDIGKIAVKESVLEKDSRIPWDRLHKIITMLKYNLKMVENEELIIHHGEESALNTEKIISEKEKLLSDIEFLTKLNTAGFLPPENEERLNEITSRKFIDIDGTESPLIDEFEHKNLSIKRGNLTDEEWLEMRSHVVKTRTIVQNIPFTKGLKNVANIAAGHHEMINGSGYPLGISGVDLPLQARIMAVADIYDALTASDRPYKKAIPFEKSIAILRDEVEKDRLDSRIVELLVEEKIYEGHKEDQAEYPWKIEVF
ncbi:MAG: HD domain-containing protein [FCB group bacterium]|nr:HD domain-containing protein [FCB group bacterium]